MAVAQRAGKMDQILRYDWLPERLRLFPLPGAFIFRYQSVCRSYESLQVPLSSM